MKIGILTLPLHTNYGGILQAYALQTTLEHMGHNVVVFDTPKRVNVTIWKYPLVLFKRCIKKYILRKPTKLFYEKWCNDTYPIISQYTQRFIREYINILEVSSFSSLNEDDYDALIVGSDQVWRPMYFCSMHKTTIENAFLAFAKDWDIKRIAYAASFGSDEWEYNSEQTRLVAEYIKKFNVVSVRELGGVKMCLTQLKVEAIHVLDPTMLLSKEDYISLIKKAEIKPSKGNLLCYILDETKEKQDIISYVAKHKNLIPFNVNSKVENLDAPIVERIQPPVESWLRGFYDAEFVVTDSFHACVFAILFQKPFVVIGNKGRGMARFHSLLEDFGLQQCLVSSYDEVKFLDIDWERMSAILQEKINFSKIKLEEALL